MKLNILIRSPQLLVYKMKSKKKTRRRRQLIIYYCIAFVTLRSVSFLVQYQFYQENHVKCLLAIRLIVH